VPDEGAAAIVRHPSKRRRNAARAMTSTTKQGRVVAAMIDRMFATLCRCKLMSEN
jgi:hypothetical protein